MMRVLIDNDNDMIMMMIMTTRMTIKQLRGMDTLKLGTSGSRKVRQNKQREQQRAIMSELITKYSNALK